MLTPPAYLSPSSIGTYRDCPQKFKFSRIDGLKEPPTWATHLGTFVHDVLEHLYQLEPDERTSDVLRTLAGDRWKAGDWESAVEALDKKQGEIKDFKIQAFNCMQNLWRLEDPQHVDLMGMEHEVNVAVEGVQLRGFIDRFLIDDTGAVVIGDYKTGKVPNPRFTSEDTKFFQLLTYALMLR